MKKITLLLLLLFLIQTNGFCVENTADPVPSATEETPKKIEKKEPVKERPTPLSGIVLTPTAYKGDGSSEIGPALDINAAYYIGRLYGKNTYTWTLEDKNYLDRIGLWLLGGEGKLVIQSETSLRPAIAAGVLGAFMFRDAPQPQLDDPSVTVNVDRSDRLASAFIAVTKKIRKKYIFNLGYAHGTYADFIPQLSEFLTPSAIELNGHPGQKAESKSLLFAGFIFLLKPNYPISVEILIPQGASQGPKLVNLHLGKLVKMNFQLSYLTYEGAWDLLGMFQFRFNFFPKRKK